MEFSFALFVGRGAPSNCRNPGLPKHDILPCARDEARIPQAQSDSAGSLMLWKREARKPSFKRKSAVFIACGDISFVNGSELFADGGSPQIRHASGLKAMRSAISSPYPDPATTGECTVQWEYKLVTEAMNADQLNKFGADGWELIEVVSPAHFVFHYFFKRELRG